MRGIVSKMIKNLEIIYCDDWRNIKLNLNNLTVLTDFDGYSSGRIMDDLRVLYTHIQHNQELLENRVYIFKLGPYTHESLTSTSEIFDKYFKADLHDDFDLYLAYLLEIKNSLFLESMPLYKVEKILVDWAWHWATEDKYVEVKEQFENLFGYTLETSVSNYQLSVFTKFNKLEFNQLSDSALLVLKLLVLVEIDELPNLLFIDSPEVYLPSDAVRKVGQLIKNLSEFTQIILRTHSAELLYCFVGEDLGKMDVKIIKDNDVVSFGEIAKEREAVYAWADDFGIGSALFDSQLIEWSNYI